MHQIKFIEDRVPLNKTIADLILFKELAIGDWFIDVQFWNSAYVEICHSLCVKIANSRMLGYQCYIRDLDNESRLRQKVYDKEITVRVEMPTPLSPDIYTKSINPNDAKAMAMPVELWPVRYEDLAPTSSGNIVDFGTWVRDGKGSIFDYAIALSDSEFLGYRTDGDHRKPLVDGSIYQCEYIGAQIRPTFVWNIKTIR